MDNSKPQTTLDPASEEFAERKSEEVSSKGLEWLIEHLDDYPYLESFKLRVWEKVAIKANTYAERYAKNG